MAVNVNRVSDTQAWELKGKLAVRTTADKFSTNLFWLHTPTQEHLTLTTMLGTNVLTLTSDKNGAKLMFDGEEYRGDNPQALLYRVTGWRLPIERLPLWITGQTSTSDQVLSRDSSGRVKSVTTEFEQQFWQLTYSKWQQQSGANVPRQMKVENPRLSLKIQINQWQALAEKP